MRKEEKKKIRLVISTTIVVLFVLTTIFSSVSASRTINIKTDADWNTWSNPPHMTAMPTGDVGIGAVPPGNAKLYVKTNNPYMDYSIYAEGGLGLKSVSTIFEGTGITGEGGHAGVCGNGYIGILGQGYYGGWFEGKGYFTGNVGIGTLEMENKLHVNGAINLDPIIEPNNPSSGFIIYCDSADGNLKAKSSSGTITILASS